MNPRHLLSILAIVTICSAPASAQLVVSQTNHYNVFASSTPGSAGYYYSFDSISNSFDKWSRPEALISVEITILGRNSGSFFVGASPAATVTSATAQQNFTFVGGGGPASIFDSSPYNLSTTPGPLPQLSSVGMFNLPDGVNLWKVNGTYTYTNSALLTSYFTGSSSFQLNLNNLLQITASGGTVIGGGLLSTGDVVVKMTAVPEPSTWALLLATAGSGLFFLRRRL